MKIEEINHPELKNHIQMIYMHGENQNEEAVEKTEQEIRELIHTLKEITDKYGEL